MGCKKTLAITHPPRPADVSVSNNREPRASSDPTTAIDLWVNECVRLPGAILHARREPTRHRWHLATEYRWVRVVS